MALDLSRGRRLTPGRIAALYLLFGVLALAVSDLLLPAVLQEPLLGLVQGAKGAIEVLVTALLVYLLVHWSWRDLRLQQRATDTAPIGITLTDPDQPDNPLVFVNDQFEAMTGYDEGEALGRNCRFLQGEETDAETLRRFRDAIDGERPVSLDVVNYRQNGEKFWNKVDIAPVRDGNGEVTHFVGFQTDITERKVREERLAVLNRVLRHNVRNKMTVIGGHAEVLERELTDPPESVERIAGAAADLRSLTETVRRSESVLAAASGSQATVDLAEQLPVLVDAFRERHPDATIDLSLPDDPLAVNGVGITHAIEEAVENALTHNDGASPTVVIRVQSDGTGWLTIEIEDDGPGIPQEEIRVLTEGETPLRHAERLGVWSIHWIVNLAGGSMTIEDSSLGGSCLRLSVPSESV